MAKNSPSTLNTAIRLPRSSTVVPCPGYSSLASNTLTYSRVSPGLETLMAYALNELPQPQDDVAFGVLNTKPRPMISSLKSIVVPLR